MICRDIIDCFVLEKKSFVLNHESTAIVFTTTPHSLSIVILQCLASLTFRLHQEFVSFSCVESVYKLHTMTIFGDSTLNCQPKRFNTLMHGRNDTLIKDLTVVEIPSLIDVLHTCT